MWACFLVIDLFVFCLCFSHHGNIQNLRLRVLNDNVAGQPISDYRDLKAPQVAMAETNLAAELLPKGETKKSKQVGVLLNAAKWITWAAMCAAFGIYVVINAAFPVTSFQKLREKLLFGLMTNTFGIGGKLSHILPYLLPNFELQVHHRCQNQLSFSRLLLFCSQD